MASSCVKEICLVLHGKSQNLMEDTHKFNYGNLMVSPPMSNICGVEARIVEASTFIINKCGLFDGSLSDDSNLRP